MIDIYLHTEVVNPKVQYVLDFISDQFVSMNFIIVNDINSTFDGHSKIIINYSQNFRKDAINIHCSDYFNNFQIEKNPTFERKLLFENKTSNFDLLAAIFFQLSRVEEYRTQQKDQHDRFQSSHSINAKMNYLDFPIVDEWIQSFKNEILKVFNIKLVEKDNYKFISTIDIDHIFAYRSKSLFIKIGSFIRDIARMNVRRIKDRFLSDDPYDTFDYLSKINVHNKIKPLAFILTSNRGKFDRSLQPSHSDFISKVLKLANYFQIGIHPSYDSNMDASKVKKEKQNLEKVTGNPIVNSRQHYLKISLPKTYQNLLKAGISNDYSMGFPDKIGFRAGTSKPFQWFDLEADSVTELTIHPFAVMDVTLKQYLNLNPKDALRLCKEVIDNIKIVHGQFIVIWHNSSFYNAEGWDGWKETYEEILSYAKFN